MFVVVVPDSAKVVYSTARLFVETLHGISICGVCKVTYDGHVYQQIEPHSKYFIDVHTGDVVELRHE